MVWKDKLILWIFALSNGMWALIWSEPSENTMVKLFLLRFSNQHPVNSISFVYRIRSSIYKKYRLPQPLQLEPMWKVPAPCAPHTIRCNLSTSLLFYHWDKLRRKFSFSSLLLSESVRCAVPNRWAKHGSSEMLEYTYVCILLPILSPLCWLHSDVDRKERKEQSVLLARLPEDAYFWEA